MVRTELALYLVLFVATLVASGLGAVIVFQAYRGYRRNDSRPMLWLAIGFSLLTLAPFTLSLLITALAPTLESESGDLLVTSVLPILSRLFEISGLACILYSLSERSR